VKTQSFLCKTVGSRLAIRIVKPAKRNTAPSRARSFAGWCCNTFYLKVFAESETLAFYTATLKKRYNSFSWYYRSSSKLSSHAPGPKCPHCQSPLNIIGFIQPNWQSG